MQKLLVLSCAAAFAVVSAAPESMPKVKRHVAYTNPVTLKQGEVTNSFHKLQIPEGPIAVYRFAADVVEKDEKGEFVPVPNFDAYLHHHVVGTDLSVADYKHDKEKWTPMKNNKVSRAVGFGAGQL